LGVDLAFYLLVITVVFGGTIALGLWAMRAHDRAYPGGAHMRGREHRRGFSLTMFTWLSGGRG
jgi:hypothetical protein